MTYLNKENTPKNQPEYSIAPALIISDCFNTPTSIDLNHFRGKVVVLQVFQMLCPACVSHSIPQAKAINQYFHDDVQVIGLHSVFEHHEVMNKKALTAFIEEYRLTFPIAIDAPSTTGPIPHTMAKYKLQGTPSLLIIDKQGRLRSKSFGHMNDLQLGSIIGRLLAESELKANYSEVNHDAGASDASTKCDSNGCSV